LTSVDLIDYHKREQYPSHKGAIAGLLLVFGAFIGLGLYSLWNLWLVNEVQIMGFITSISPMLADNLWMLGAGLYLLVTGVYTIQTLLASWPILIPGIFTLFITLLLFTVFKDRIRRAGEIIKLTGQVTLDEKGTFVPPLLSMIFTLFSAVLFAGIMVYFMPQILVPGYEFVLETDWGYIVGLVTYLFVTIFFYNFAYSTTSAITYIYMRGQDPTLGDGVKASLGVSGGLIVLSIMSVIVKLIQIAIHALTRKSASPLTRGVGRAGSGIVGWVWMLINYFTIPAMVDLVC